MALRSGSNSRFDSWGVRFVLWLLSAVVLSVLVYFGELVSVVSKAEGMFSGEFGSTFALGGLLILVFFLLLRKDEFLYVLSEERGFTSKMSMRLGGLVLALAPILIRGFVPSSVAISAVFVVLVWVGLFLAITPSTFELLYPYTLLFIVFTVAPALVQVIVGEPLADVAAYLTGGVLSIAQVPGVWAGREFTIFSTSGVSVPVLITPGCSSISSISVFLLLTGLMHLDLRKRLSSTLIMAVVGFVGLTLLNALRIVALIWTGYSSGAEAMWSLHSWLGYAVFTVFYTAILLIYARSARHSAFENKSRSEDFKSVSSEVS